MNNDIVTKARLNAALGTEENVGFEHNDIVTEAKLNAALGTEGNMGFEHNDIVTVDKMNEAISGGGGDDPSTENFKIALLDGIAANKVGIFIDDDSMNLQSLLDNEVVTIDSDNIITFPTTANGLSFNFEYIGTGFSYGISDAEMIELNEDSTQSDSIVIEPNTMYLVKGTGK